MIISKMLKAILLTVVYMGISASGISGWSIDPAHAAGIQAYSIQADGKTRTYAVYAPSSYTNKHKTAVVVMLHGVGGTGEGVVRETGWDQKAEKEGFLVVFPDAMRVNPEAEPSFLFNPQMWNDGSNRGQGQINEVNDVKFLSLMLDDVAKNYTIDQTAVFATGFSSGASMLFRAANELPGRFAAIAPVSGHYWAPTAAPAKRNPIPTILIIGTADPLNPYNGGVISLPWGSFEQPSYKKTIDRWLKHTSLPQELKAAQSSPGVKVQTVARDKRDIFRVVIVEGLGHMWPGGEPIFPEGFIGKDPGTVNATQAIWDYFKSVRAQNH